MSRTSFPDILCVRGRKVGLHSRQSDSGFVGSHSLHTVRYFDNDTLISHESDTMLNAFSNVMLATAGSFSPLAIGGHVTNLIS